MVVLAVVTLEDRSHLRLELDVADASVDLGGATKDFVTVSENFLRLRIFRNVFLKEPLLIQPHIVQWLILPSSNLERHEAPWYYGHLRTRDGPYLVNFSCTKLTLNIKKVLPNYSYYHMFNFNRFHSKFGTPFLCARMDKKNQKACDMHYPCISDAIFWICWFFPLACNQFCPRLRSVSTQILLNSDH